MLRKGGDALVNLIIEHTHTCYLGDRVHRHAWGLGLRRLPSVRFAGPGLPADGSSTVWAWQACRDDMKSIADNYRLMLGNF
jgi:hypothetical protein